MDLQTRISGNCGWLGCAAAALADGEALDVAMDMPGFDATAQMTFAGVTGVLLVHQVCCVGERRNLLVLQTPSWVERCAATVLARSSC